VTSSGRSIGPVAKELGVRDSVLRRWVEKLDTGRASTVAPQSPDGAKSCLTLSTFRGKINIRGTIVKSRKVAELRQAHCKAARKQGANTK
jgi:transposase-like protein